MISRYNPTNGFGLTCYYDYSILLNFIFLLLTFKSYVDMKINPPHQLYYHFSIWFS